LHSVQADRKISKKKPKGREGVYEENSDFRGKITNRRGKKQKIY
jgi:hypothetical protein